MFCTREMQETFLNNTRRMRYTANKITIREGDRTEERAAAWEAATERVSEAVLLCHPRAARSVLIFPYASDEFWVGCVTQVPPEELGAGGDGAEMSHVPLAFLSGALKGSQRSWSVVDKETCAIESTFLRLTYMFWDGRCSHILQPS